jgi:hypothetical protein
MAVSDILVLWQKALTDIGAKSNIASLTEQSAEAAACALNYEDTVRELVRAADWNFCRRRVVLSQATSPAPAIQPQSWGYTYTYPTDCVAIRGFDFGVPVRYFPYNEVPWEEGNDSAAGRVIYMNEMPVASTSPVLVYSAYTFDSAVGTWEAYFDAAFQNAVEWALASAIGPALGASARAIQRADQQAEVQRQRAMASNGNQQSPSSMDQAQAESLLVRGALDPYQMPYPSTV